MKMIQMLLLFCFSLWAGVNPLQQAIDRASPYATIRLSEGVYRGNIVIDKPLTLVGVTAGVHIRGEKSGSVVTIKSSFVRLENLTISDSGDLAITLDAAISMDQVSHCSITRCTLKNVRYGIDMKLVSDSNISGNRISSNGQEKPMRGDAIKLWYGHRNRITHNQITDSRDITIAFSRDTLLADNNISRGRYGLSMERSVHTRIIRNIFRHNSAGIVMMASQDSNITHNQILSCDGAAGIGVVIQGGGKVRFSHNKVSYNAQAFYIDSKGKEKGMRRYFTDNIISYNKEGFHFHQIIKNNTIMHNRISGNLDDIVMDIAGTYTRENRIERNYWDHYEGFDRDEDNIGDTPHQVYLYADQLWQYNHKIKFFYGSPIMSLLDFLSRVAPFIEPHLLLEDTAPYIMAPAT